MRKLPIHPGPRRVRAGPVRPGHRIMVQVQSTWFPLVDRNPQKFLNIPGATATDFQKATQRVYYTPERPSRLTVLQLGE